MPLWFLDLFSSFCFRILELKLQTLCGMELMWKTSTVKKLLEKQINIFSLIFFFSLTGIMTIILKKTQLSRKPVLVLGTL